MGGLKTKTGSEIAKNPEISKEEKSWRDLKTGIENGAENAPVVTAVKQKIKSFCSFQTVGTPNEALILDGYHFDTFRWGGNVKPNLGMIVDEVHSLNNPFQRMIDEYLKANPADIMNLQKKLNIWINSGMVIDDKDSPTGRRTIYPINLEILMVALRGTEMELTDNGANSKMRHTIEEDGKFGPQTFAVLCCFKEQFRNSSTAYTNRGTRQS